MDEIMYDHNSVLICLILLVTMVAGLEIGFRGGSKWRERIGDGQRTQLNAVQGSLLGMLALLLGFTFSLALQRFDDRSKAVVDEANAIGTALLRASVLDATVSTEATASLRAYIDLRVHSAGVSLDYHDERDDLLVRSEQVQAELWSQVQRALQIDDRPATTGLYLQALNDMFDAYGRRDAALSRHVPEAVLFLLFLTFVMVSTIVGITSGAHGGRPPKSMIAMVTLIVMLVFIIIDLDRPRRGIIEIDQSSLIKLQQPASSGRTP
ncbi:bestrophin-like domain [Woeseia oceani]|nr:DUF4239 domain-containing protein [Woeseia oceani]